MKISNIVMCFVLMVFMHIVDDFYLQGILAKLKQKSFWRDETPWESYTRLYRHDYIIALADHAFSWCVCIHIPMFVVWYMCGGFSLIAFLINFVTQATIHAVIDNLKANKFKINLIEDQLLHIVQISFTLALHMVVR